MDKELVKLLLVQNKLLELILRKEYDISERKANSIVNKLLKESEEKIDQYLKGKK